ncbi:hypothetical protein PG994_003364 [Apiospora phragmitis]|uniref:Uncharacterized protein n=1 Tax=Apiospora phragmitis TaxID=2905665 RepID=A0ABR1VY37_9PEZI
MQVENFSTGLKAWVHLERAAGFPARIRSTDQRIRDAFKAATENISNGGLVSWLSHIKLLDLIDRLKALIQTERRVAGQGALLGDKTYRTSLGYSGGRIDIFSYDLYEYCGITRRSERNDILEALAARIQHDNGPSMAKVYCALEKITHGLLKSGEEVDFKQVRNAVEHELDL